MAFATESGEVHKRGKTRRSKPFFAAFEKKHPKAIKMKTNSFRGDYFGNNLKVGIGYFACRLAAAGKLHRAHLSP